MKSQFKTYLQFLGNDKNLIIYSNESLEEYEDIFMMFKTFCVIEINQFTLENISTVLLDNKADMVIVFDNENDEDIIKIFSSIKVFNKNIDTLFISKNIKLSLHDILNEVDSILFKPMNINNLAKGLFTALSTSYTLKNIINTEKSLSKIPKPIDIDDFEEFLDTWEGKIMFLSQDIDEIVSRFDSGELSNELIQLCIEKIDEVEKIFRSTSYTKKVSPIFDKLSKYLKVLKIENIDIKNVEGFEYLSRIMEDINTYIVEYFVDRIFKDVHVFEDSLLSNINFMENKLAGCGDDDSELHFF